MRKVNFLNAAEGQEVLNIAAAEAFDFADVDHLGQVCMKTTHIRKNISRVFWHWIWSMSMRFARPDSK